MNPPRFFRCVGIALLIVAAVLGPITFWPISPPRESARRSVASLNLRQIGQASLIYAQGRGDRLPATNNIWDYAGELARGGGLNDATVWTMIDDPANRDLVAGLGTVLTMDKRGLEPEFRKLVPSWAVPLGALDANMPATTPIGWTRGLRPDGTWSPHSPYGTTGGHIVFLGGDVAFFHNVKDALTRFDGTGKTSNILEALPPGTRIGEYVPSEDDQRAWARTRWQMKISSAVDRLVLPGSWLAALVALLVQTTRKRWPAWLLVWFLVFSFLAALLMPTGG